MEIRRIGYTVRRVPKIHTKIAVVGGKRKLFYSCLLFFVCSPEYCHKKRKLICFGTRKALVWVSIGVSLNSGVRRHLFRFCLFCFFFFLLFFVDLLSLLLLICARNPPIEGGRLRKIESLLLFRREYYVAFLLSPIFFWFLFPRLHYIRLHW